MARSYFKRTTIAAILSGAILATADGSELDKTVSSDPNCQTVRENAARVTRSAIGDADGLSACLRRSDLADDCDRRFRAVKNAKDALEGALAQVASNCR